MRKAWYTALRAGLIVRSDDGNEGVIEGVDYDSGVAVRVYFKTIEGNGLIRPPSELEVLTSH